MGELSEESLVMSSDPCLMTATYSGWTRELLVMSSDFSIVKATHYERTCVSPAPCVGWGVQKRRRKKTVRSMAGQGLVLIQDGLCLVEYRPGGGHDRLVGQWIVAAGDYWWLVLQ